MVSLLVRDYDEAIEFFVGRLGFRLAEDTDLGDGKRWVVVEPDRSRGASLLLARAASEAATNSVGNQAGGRVFLFLYTDDFAADYERMTASGVRFTERPREEPYGTVVVFEDLYGNRWDLIGPRSDGQASDE